jgi:hypothetical protein
MEGYMAFLDYYQSGWDISQAIENEVLRRFLGLFWHVLLCEFQKPIPQRKHPKCPCPVCNCMTIEWMS